MRRVVWLAAALTDLKDVYDYVVERNPSAAVDLINAIRETGEHLNDQPSMGRKAKTPNTRRLVVPRTPYILWYRHNNELIEIIRVIHGARDMSDKV